MSGLQNVYQLRKFEYPEDFDEDCRYACDFFNSLGLKTKFSCSGHGVDDFYIMFDDTVTDNMIELFQIYAFNKCPMGRFVKWKRLVYPEGTRSLTGAVLWENWMYCVNLGFKNLDVRIQRDIRNITTTVTKEVLLEKVDDFFNLALQRNLDYVAKDILDFKQSMEEHGFTFITQD